MAVRNVVAFNMASCRVLFAGIFTLSSCFLNSRGVLLLRGMLFFFLVSQFTIVRGASTLRVPLQVFAWGASSLRMAPQVFACTSSLRVALQVFVCRFKSSCGASSLRVGLRVLLVRCGNIGSNPAMHSGRMIH